MLKNIFKFELNNYWRNIDKNILVGFIILFFLGLFFSFASTSSLAGERLNKTYYFFFFKTFDIHYICASIDVCDICLRNIFFEKNYYYSFSIFFNIINFSADPWNRG